MRIPEEFIESVREASDVVEVIGEHLPLLPAGKRSKALCPFHVEKTASFTVNPELQMFHCFGCGVGGNVFTFLMRHLGLTFPEAVELLARRAGLEMPRGSTGRREEGGAGGVLTALEEAARLFERNLWEREAGGRARAYLDKRGIEPATARAARLGFAMPGFDHLRGQLGGRLGLRTLVSAGLLVEKDGGRPYDRFRDRLVFPVQAPSGRVLGFGARSLDGSEPKYLNSPETPVYRKREVLYGLNLARLTLARDRVAHVVEGYMDVLALRQVGIEQAVAVSGTALTTAQAGTLARYARGVVLLFDGDAAGRQAVARSLPALLGAGLEVRVALMPPGEDPDSLARSGGRQGLEELVRSSSSVVQFIVYLCQLTDLPEGSPPTADPRPESLALSAPARRAALGRLVEIGAMIPDRLSRRLLVEETSRRLGFDEATLAEEVEARRRTPATRPPVRPDRGTAARPAPPRIDRRLEGLLGLALADTRVLETMRDRLAPGDLPDGPHRSLYQRLLAQEPGRAPGVISGVTEEVESLAAALAMRPLPEDRERAARELLGAFESDGLRRELRRLQGEIRDHESAGRAEQVPPLLARVQELLESLRSA